MRFGKSIQPKLEKGIPFALKRQLIVLLLLLSIVVLLSYRLLVGVRESNSPPPRGGAENLTPVKVSPQPSRTLLEESGVPPVGEGEVPEELAAPQPPELFEENPEVLAQAAAKDRTGELDDEATAYYFQKMLTRKADFQSEAPVLSLYRGDRVFQELLDRPDRYRGKLVEVKGILISDGGPRESPLELRGLKFPNPSGLDRAYRSNLYGTDDKFYHVSTLKEHPGLSHRDGVRLRAYFCQVYSYDAQIEGEAQRVSVPFLVGEDYELVEMPVATVPDLTSWLPFLVFLPMAAFVVIYLVNRRAQRSFEVRRKAARRRPREVSSGSTSSERSAADSTPSTASMPDAVLRPSPRALIDGPEAALPEEGTSEVSGGA